MDVVDTWTGRHANALRQAQRLSIAAFAERLGTAVRTVAKWNAEPALVPTPEIQRALDTVLHQSPPEVKARFALLVQENEPANAPAAPSQLSPEISDRLRFDHDIAAALDWLDRAAEWDVGTSHRKVEALLRTMDADTIQARGRRRGRVHRPEIASALSQYYGAHETDFGLYTASCEGAPVPTSMLTHQDWLDLCCQLDAPHDQVAFTDAWSEGPTLTDVAAKAATERMAEVLLSATKLVNAPIYNLTGLDVGPEGLKGTVGIAEFASYALTMDLLESELIDAIIEGRPMEPGSMPLRDQHLPNVGQVVNVDSRLCAGGALALLAIARPASATHTRKADFLLLIQERSGRVLNAAQRLAVIPKAFHGPLADYSDDARIGSTLLREMEEELFGRTDVDSTFGANRSADPMHPSRLSAPMRWLTEHPQAWHMECTGVGFNLVSGNYEFASLIAITDETWWAEFGGHVEANWESDSIRRYSSQNRQLLANLVTDPAWSNEGLFAFLQGIRRLATLAPERTNLPMTELELT